MPVTVINCTPHLLHTPKRMYETSGHIARVECNYAVIGEVDGMPVLQEFRRRVVGLPEPQPNTLYIVSRVVFYATDRTDVISPSGQVKEQGVVIASHQFVAKEGCVGLAKAERKHIPVRQVRGVIYRDQPHTGRSVGFRAMQNR